MIPGVSGVLEYIESKLGQARADADIYLDVTDALKGYTLKEVTVFCQEFDISIDGMSGRWVIPLFSFKKPEGYGRI